jgi:hypothetical protein|tara:strand:+ start:130 stop:1842 length:1713 start_codon:yes stop_codon:yes gene_type:complete
MSARGGDGRGDGAKKTTSYVDDLLSGSVNFMDARAARGARSMRTMGANASGGTRSTAVKAVNAPRAPRTEMKTPETTGTGGDDLEAFFGTSRVDARAGGGPDASNASSSSFGDLDAFASASASASRSREAGGRDGDEEDDFMRGLGLGARGTTTKGMARATSGGSDGNDLFDLLSASSSVSGSRPTSPGGRVAAKPTPTTTRLQTTTADEDESLIDGLDEILGEVSIASTPRKSASVEKMASTSSLSSASKSASRLEAEAEASSPESEAPVGLARFRSNASAESRESAPTMTQTPPRVKVEVRPKSSKPPTGEPARTTKPTTTPAPEPAPKPKPTTTTTTTSSARSSVDDLDDFFSAGGATTPRQAPVKSDVDPIEAMFTVNQSNAPSTPADGVVDDLFGAMDVRGMSAAKASVSFEYNPEEKVDPNEPPERAALRKARHERNRQRIEAALKEKRARETAARQEQSERQMLKDLIGADIDAWQKKNQNNIRTMLANLADVLWEGHRYKSPDMGALMQPVGVKKCYHRALVVIHPDKVSQAGGDMSQRYIADKVFDIVKVAYKEFEAKELK